MSVPLLQQHDLPRLQRWCFAVAAAATIGCAAGAFLDIQGFFRSYLFAWLSWLSIPLGSLMIVMVHHLTGGHWGRPLRPVLKTAMGTMPLFAALFFLVAVGIPYLYEWADAERLAADQALRDKTAYLNVPRFLFSAAVYFAVWVGMSWRLSRLQDKWLQTQDEKAAGRARQLSAVGLLILGLTVTFAAIDWIMSLEPHWYSSIFGMLIASAVALPAFAFNVLVVTWRNSEPQAKEIAADTWNDLGNLLLAMLMLWAYMAFSQYFLIWCGNLPEEIPWYLRRTRGIWQWLAVGMIVFYFFLPFFLLLARDLKRDPKRLAIVAALIVLMHFVHEYWLIKPAFLQHQGSGRGGIFQGMHWLDPVAFLAVGGVWGGLFVNRLQRVDVSRSQVIPNQPETDMPEEDAAHED